MQYAMSKKKNQAEDNDQNEGKKSFQEIKQYVSYLSQIEIL